MSDETFPGGSGLFILTSIYRPDGNKPLIVHSWGPYNSRREANNARNRAKTQSRRDARRWFEEDHFATGRLTFHVGEAFGRPADPKVEVDVVALAKRLEEAAAIIDQFVDPDPCEYDHNHSCQAHGFYFIPADKQCPVQQGKDYLL